MVFEYFGPYAATRWSEDAEQDGPSVVLAADLQARPRSAAAKRWRRPA